MGSAEKSTVPKRYFLFGTETVRDHGRKFAIGMKYVDYISGSDFMPTILCHLPFISPFAGNTQTPILCRFSFGFANQHKFGLKCTRGSCARIFHANCVYVIAVEVIFQKEEVTSGHSQLSRQVVWILHVSVHAHRTAIVTAS